MTSPDQQSERNTDHFQAEAVKRLYASGSLEVMWSRCPGTKQKPDWDQAGRKAAVKSGPSAGKCLVRLGDGCLQPEFGFQRSIFLNVYDSFTLEF